MPIWAASYRQIVEGDFWFPTSGRTIDVLFSSDTNKIFEWSMGAHNTYLEILRNNGLFFGTVLIFIMFSLLVITLKNRPENSAGYSLFAISLCVTAGLGLLLGDFIVDAGFGGLFWTAVGFVIWRLHHLEFLSHQQLMETSR